MSNKELFRIETKIVRHSLESTYYGIRNKMNRLYNETMIPHYSKVKLSYSDGFLIVSKRV